MQIILICIKDIDAIQFIIYKTIRYKLVSARSPILWNLKLGYHWRMIGGTLEFSWGPVDRADNATLGQRHAAEDMIDAQTEISAKRPLTIVPPGVALERLIEAAKDIDQADADDVAQCLALRFAE